MSVRAIPNDEWDDFFEENRCHHGNRSDECEECDAEIESHGGIEKCMRCGRYRYGDQLNAFQVCIKACQNPNEY